MPRLSEPTQSVPASSSAARAGRLPSSSERIIVAGQPGPCPNGSEDCLEAQMQRAWTNLFDAMKAAGFEKRDLVKTTVCVTEGGHLSLYRSMRDRMLQGHSAASAYLHVPGLGAPNRLVEIEAEVRKSRS